MAVWYGIAIRFILLCEEEILADINLAVCQITNLIPGKFSGYDNELRSGFHVLYGVCRISIDARKYVMAELELCRFSKS